LEFLVISYAVLSFVLFSLVFSKWGIKTDHKQKRLDYISGTAQSAAYQELEQSFFNRFFAPKIKKAQKTIEKLTPKKKTRKKDEKNNALERQLRLAGIFKDASEFNFIKTVVLIITVVTVLILILVMRPGRYAALLLLLTSILIGFMGPTLYLRSRVSGHQGGIRKQLPDAMDLLGVCIEAGLSFDSALLKIAERLKGPFVDELLIVHREIAMGLSRRDALQNLSNSSDIDELKTFASALVQAEQLGIPINNVMKVQSAQLRLTRSQQAQEKGRKASIKMLIPMLLFIFPVIFIIVLGPTVMTIIENFGG
jgi:tight adherence protein C